MEQVPAAKGPVQGVVRARAEAEWVDRLQQVRAEIVFVRNAELRLLMLSDSLVMQKAVRSVEQK